MRAVNRITRQSMAAPRFMSSISGHSGSKTACDLTGRRVSSVFKNLKVGPMKRLYKYYTEDSVNIAGGVPMESCFPITKIKVTLDDGTEYELPRGQNLSLNYQRGDGMPALKAWVDQHVANLHKPPVPVMSCVSTGSTDAYSKVINLLECDSILFDKYSYGHAVACCQQFGKETIGVDVDEEGILPASLKSTVLAARARGRTANILYLVPTGQNPTGTTMSFTRIQQVYKVCQELDIMVIEDDAYYYLYYGRPDGRNVPETSMPGLRGLPRSFLSIDTDNRVIRLDSLSKFVAPGMRLGWVTAAPALIEKYLLLQEATTQFPSGVAQSVFTGLVKHWGEDGLDAHVRKTQAHYLRQRDATVDALKACFPNNEVSYALPDCGMFIWLTFNGMKLSPFELFEMFAGTGVIVVPATDFFVPGPDTGTVEEASKSPAVRITFAASSPAQIRTGIERMAEAILKHHGH